MGNDAHTRPTALSNGRRAALAGLIGTAVIAPLALAGAYGPASATPGRCSRAAATMPASGRAQPAPNVVYPLPAYAKGRDLKTFRTGYEATEIVAACGVAVRAVHPGTVHLTPNQPPAGRWSASPPATAG